MATTSHPSPGNGAASSLKSAHGAENGSPARNVILLVDNDPDWRLIIADWLNEAGYRCIAAANPSEAIRLAVTTSVSAIVFDASLGPPEDFTFVRAITRIYRNKPLILCSAQEHTEFEVAGMRSSGAIEFVQKGVPTLLLNAIARAVAACAD